MGLNKNFQLKLISTDVQVPYRLSYSRYPLYLLRISSLTGCVDTGLRDRRKQKWLRRWTKTEVNVSEG